MIVALLLLACGPEPSGRLGDPAADSASPNVDCIDAPLVTYATFGEGFITFYCQGCHGSEVEDRRGSPESVTFDDHESVLRWRNFIRARVLSDPPSMPPAGGLPEDDLEKLRIWLECWERDSVRTGGSE